VRLLRLKIYMPAVENTQAESLVPEDFQPRLSDDWPDNFDDESVSSCRTLNHLANENADSNV